MLAPSWVSLLRQIPATYHDVLVIITATGAEIIIQKILVMEADYMVMRGRLSGVQDGGMVMIMPYDQISNLAFNKRMLEQEVFQIFGSSGVVAAAAVSPAPAAANTATPPVPANGAPAPAAPEPVSSTQAERVAAAPANASTETLADINTVEPATERAAEQSPPAKPSQPSKTTLLARLRARLAGQSKA